MPETRTYTVYKFNELPEDIQEKAISKLWDINIDYDWWDGVYNDANELGLEITGFDLGHRWDINIEFVSTALETAIKIISEHGEQCETYQIAKNYLENRTKAKRKAILLADVSLGSYELDDIRDNDFNTDDIDREFLYALGQDYMVILRNDYEYLTSKEAIRETIEANDYWFDENGNIK